MDREDLILAEEYRETKVKREDILNSSNSLFISKSKVVPQLEMTQGKQVEQIPQIRMEQIPRQLRIEINSNTAPMFTTSPITNFFSQVSITYS